MFLGFGTLSGGANAVGQAVDRPSFQLVSAETFSYRARQCGATAEVLWRKQREGKSSSGQRKQNKPGVLRTMRKHSVSNHLPAANDRP
jgi:hypothetical protein